MKKLMISLTSVALVALVGSMATAQVPQKKVPMPGQPQQIEVNPKFKLKVADLAAVSIFGSVNGDIVAGTAKPNTVGVVKNVDTIVYHGSRKAYLQYKVGNGSWHTFASATIPTGLKAGASFQVA